MPSQDISNLQKELKQLHDSLNALKEIKMNKPISSMSSSVFSTREAAKAFRPEPGKALSTEEVEKLVTNESDMADYVENLISKNLDDVIGKILGD